MSIEIVKANVVPIVTPSTFKNMRVSGIAAKTCTSADSFAEILDADTDYLDVLKRVINYGHLSVTEFDTWVFGVENVSRTMTHQLVRKRIGVAYGQESMRYASQAGVYKIIVPDTLKDKRYDIDLPNLGGKINLSLEDLATISHNWYEAAQVEGVPNEDARFGLLEASKTKILVGMNTHALLDFFKERTCNTAQWEIRDVAKKMLMICKEYDPEVFEGAGPKCNYTNVCNEPKVKWKTCQRVPHKSNSALIGDVASFIEQLNLTEAQIETALKILKG
jgi:thymidylate synthase (FAD)